MTKDSLFLLLSLQIAHLLGDFSPLSTKWMLAAKQSGKPLFPIFCHAMVHAALMFFPLHFFCGYSITVIDLADAMILFQLISHFLIDVWKGKMSVWFPIFIDQNKAAFWYLFGIDQFFHQIVIIIMCFICLN